MKYKIIIEKARTNYSAYSPDVPGCVATGKTRVEVTHNLETAIKYHLAEEIRQFAGEKYIEPLRKKGGGVVKIRAGDVHRAMNLNNRMPAVCGALDTKLFREFFNVELVSREGPKQGANALFGFKFDPNRRAAPRNPFCIEASGYQISDQSRLAEKIRQFVGKNHIQTARKKGRRVVEIRAGDVHRAMNLDNRMPAVCGALDTKAFRESFDVKLISRKGPKQGANALFEFQV